MKKKRPCIEMEQSMNLRLWDDKWLVTKDSVCWKDMGKKHSRQELFLVMKYRSLVELPTIYQWSQDVVGHTIENWEAWADSSWCFHRSTPFKILKSHYFVKSKRENWGKDITFETWLDSLRKIDFMSCKVDWSVPLWW